MSRFRRLTFLLLVSALFAATPLTIAAQDGPPTQDPPVDVEALETSLLKLRRGELSEKLIALPLLDTTLPDGFADAEYVDPTVPSATGTTRGQQGVLPFEDLITLTEIEATVAFTVAGDPAVLGGSGNTTSLAYVIFDPIALADDSITGDTLEQIEEGIEETFKNDTVVTVEETFELDPVVTAEIDDQGDEIDDDGETLVEGLPGRLVTFTLNSGTTNAATQLYILPIGNVFIFSLVTVADDGPVNPNDIAGPAERLTLAGIEHLEDAVISLGPR